MHANWITGIYTVEDGIFKFHEHEDQIRWLQNIIKEKLGRDHLWDENGEYKWKPKDEYEGFKRDLSSNRVSNRIEILENELIEEKKITDLASYACTNGTWDTTQKLARSRQKSRREV